ncbi:hypothetical protein SAMN04489725_105116 [Alicyclobacillus hesperidum]|uniref:Uncharacterized protein n=1 Tax=Alicyclobacillus hesperidum TaxID=89784 RepID=A0A1H2T8D6_9BACL|nr:hypothetical protein SAMN04489725_105116 [Alicyclobacillus hesperidum]
MSAFVQQAIWITDDYLDQDERSFDQECFPFAIWVST